jgi:hypothetical protein
MNLAIMYDQAWYWVEELCDIIRPRLSIKSAIQVYDLTSPASVTWQYLAGVSQIRRLWVSNSSDAPNCLKALFFFRLCSMHPLSYSYLILSVSAISSRSPLPLQRRSARPTIYWLTSLPNLSFPCTQPCHAEMLATEGCF